MCDNNMCNNIDENVNEKKNQLFKKNVPINVIWDFLEENFEDKDTHFIINKFLYKKSDYNKNLTKFTESLKEYYNNSKKKYVERTMNYNFFLTVIRQLCNVYNIVYTSKLIYNKSSYEIEYCIYKGASSTCSESLLSRYQ